MRNIKILVAYHKYDDILRSQVYQPIQLGRVIANEKSKDGKLALDEQERLKNLMIGDDTGDNLSNENRCLNEMTAVYWAWKNYDNLGSPEYIGLVHYRRHFIFLDQRLENEEWLPNSNALVFSYMTTQYKSLISEKHLDKILNDYDGVSSYLYDLRNLNPRYLSCRDRFVEMVGLDGQLFDLAIRYILENFPEYYHDVKLFQREPKNYLCNMFVFKREDFFDYCQFVFPILKKLLENRDLFENKGVTQGRAPGFISEWLTTIFIFHLIRVKKRRFKQCRISFIEDTLPCEKVAIQKRRSAKVALGYLVLTGAQILTLNRLPIRFRELRKRTKASLADYNHKTRLNSIVSLLVFKISNKLARVFIKVANFLTI